MGWFSLLFGSKKQRERDNERLAQTAKESGEKLVRKRVIPAPTGRPPLEPICHEVYDTQILPPEGTTRMEFFSNPDLSNRLLTNMREPGVLPQDNQLHAFGLAIDVYSVHPRIEQKIINTASKFDKLKELLFANATITFFLNQKLYVEIPVNRVVGEPLPPGCIGQPSDSVITSKFVAPFDITMREAIENPEKHRKLMEDYTLQIFIGNHEKENFYYDTVIDRPRGKSIRVIVTDQPLCINYFDLCFVRETGSGKRRQPLHIPSECSFRAVVEWQEAIPYDQDFLGKVHVRVGLPGVLWRPVV